MSITITPDFNLPPEQNKSLEANNLAEPLNLAARRIMGGLNTALDSAGVNANLKILETSHPSEKRQVSKFNQVMQQSIRDGITEGYRFWGRKFSDISGKSRISPELFRDKFYEWDNAFTDGPLKQLEAKSPHLKTIIDNLKSTYTGRLIGVEQKSLENLYELYMGKTPFLADGQLIRLETDDIREALKIGVNYLCQREIFTGLFTSLYPYDEKKRGKRL